MSTKNIRDNLIDHLAIRDLIDRYTIGVNLRDWDAVENVFSSTDGTWDVGGPEMGEFSYLFEGGAKNVVENMKKVIGSTDLCFQTNSAIVIEVNGDRATARCTIHELARPLDGNSGVNLRGIYYDDIVREKDGEWRFRKRSFRFVYLDTSKLPGNVIAPFSKPLVV